MVKKIVYNYYLISKGIDPEKEDFDTTLATARYLEDNNYSESEILRILICCNKNKIEGKDLPDILWNDSLIERDKFYYSDVLHIKSNPPSWNPITFKEECPPFYLEMKINFTMNDLLEYYYEKCRVPIALQDIKKDSGAMKHLIAKYDAFKNAPGLDYVIALINKASEDIEKTMFTNIFEIENYKEDIIKDFAEMVSAAEFEKTNKIVWRS